MRIQILLASAALFFLGCNYSILKGSDQDPSQTRLGDLNSETKIGWSLMQSHVLITCLQCHASSQQPVFGDLASARANFSVIQSEVASNSMPPKSNGYSPLSECQKALLDNWVHAGGPEQGSDSVGQVVACKSTIAAGDIPIDQLPLTYNNLLTKVLQPRCLKCHNSDNPLDPDASGILFFPLDVLNSLGQVDRWLAPGDQSDVVRLLLATDDSRMPPPEDSPALSAAEIDFVKRWIDAGRPE